MASMASMASTASMPREGGDDARDTASAAVGIKYDRRTPDGVERALRTVREATYHSDAVRKLKQDNAEYDPYRNETRARWMNRSRKDEGDKAQSTRYLSEYGPHFPQQLTEEDFIIARANPAKQGQHDMHSSRRDRNPRYADEFILALQEGASFVDDDDKNQSLGYDAQGRHVRPSISWATTLPLQFAYSPTLPFFRQPRQPPLADGAPVRAPYVAEREPPLPVGDCDSAGWLDRYGTQRLTPWVYASPSNYSQTDIQFRTPRMDVVDTGPSKKQLKDPYTRYAEGGLPCVTNALSRNAPHGRVHDLSYAHMSIEDAMDQSVDSRSAAAAGFHTLHSPWEQGVSLVHFKFGSAETDDETLHATEGLPPWGEPELYDRHVAERQVVEHARATAANQLAKAKTDLAKAQAAASNPGLTRKQLESTHLHLHTKEVERLEAQLAPLAERASALARDLPTRQEFETRDAERVAQQNALRWRLMNEPVRLRRSPHLGGHAEEDPRRATRLIAVSEQTAIKWMEDCGLSSSVTLRDDVDPVHARRKFNLVLRPPIEAFAHWQDDGSMWSKKMGWQPKVDDDLTTYPVLETHVHNYRTHFMEGKYKWVARRFEYRTPGAEGGGEDRESGEPLFPHRLVIPPPAASSRPRWDVLYMRTRAYETRLTSSKRYYLNHPIELLSSSATMSADGYASVDAGCLGCIYTGVPKFDAHANSLHYKWPNPVQGMVTYLMGAEVFHATGDRDATDGFYHVAIVWTTADDDTVGHEASVEHVIPQHTISVAAHAGAGAGNGLARLRQGADAPMPGDGDVRARFADYVCGDPFNWLVSVANPNRRRGALALGVCGDDLADLVVARRTNVAVAHEAVHDEDSTVRGAHDHFFPVPEEAWLRVALVQIYMYLTYPGLPPLMADDSTGSPLDAQGHPLAPVDYDINGHLLVPVDGNPKPAPTMRIKEHARFGVVKLGTERAHFMLPGFNAKQTRTAYEDQAEAAKQAAPDDPPQYTYAVLESRSNTTLGTHWLKAVLNPSSNEWLVAPGAPAGATFPTHWDDTGVSARTGRVVMTTEKRIKLFRILLRTVATKELCEADVLLASLVQKATGFMLSEYEQMCARLDATRDNGDPLTSSDGLYAAWTGNSDGAYGATIRTRYPRGWRNPLFHWSARRRHGFVQQPTVYRFLGAAMYGLSADDAQRAAVLASVDVADAARPAAA